MHGTPLPLFLLSLVLAGCATGPVYVNKELPGDAHLLVSHTEILAWVGGASSIQVTAIDGGRTVAADEYFLRPGKHMVRAMVYAMTPFSRKEGSMFLEIDLSTSHKYRISSSHSGPDFMIKLVDETDSKAILVVATYPLAAIKRIDLPLPSPGSIKIR